MADYIKTVDWTYTDVINGCAPFVLNMTLEHSPEFAERFKRIEIPERNKLAIRQAISEIGQKPSVFQRIKNWFIN